MLWCVGSKMAEISQQQLIDVYRTCFNMLCGRLRCNESCLIIAGLHSRILGIWPEKFHSNSHLVSEGLMQDDCVYKLKSKYWTMRGRGGMYVCQTCCKTYTNPVDDWSGNVYLLTWFYFLSPCFLLLKSPFSCNGAGWLVFLCLRFTLSTGSQAAIEFHCRQKVK